MSGKEHNNFLKATFVLKIIALSFAILTFFIVISALVTKFILKMNEKVKIAHTREAKVKARKNKLRRERVRHILKQRKLAKHQKKRASKENCSSSDIIDSKDENDEDLEDFMEDLDNLLIEEE